MDFFDALVRYETGLWNHLENQLRRADGASLGTVVSLRALARRVEPCRVQDLRADLRISVGAASKLVDRLERHGFATRRPNPADRRSSWIEITESGRRRLERDLDVLDAELAAHLGAGPEVEVVASAIARLDQRLTAATS